MGLFGSLFTGVSALGAQSQATAMISNNIANVNTTGFKRSEASFFSLVTTEGRSSRYSPGTVTADRIQRVDQQGSISQSTSATDASISGNGMFAVKRDSADSALTPYLYTRNGQFSEDAEGFMRNSAGFYLYGWPIDRLGALPANQGDLTSLVPVDVAFLGGLTRPTNNAEMAINLDSRTSNNTLANISGALTATDFQRGLTVYDSLGNAQPITFEFKKTYGPEATLASSQQSVTATDELVNDLGITAGSQFTVADEGGPIITLDVVAGTPAAATDVQTVGDLLAALDGAGGGDIRATLGNDGEILLQRTAFVGAAGAFNISVTDAVGDFATTLFGGSPAAQTSSNLFDGLYDQSNGSTADNPDYSGDVTNETFPAFQHYPGDTNYNSNGWWELAIRDPNNNIITGGRGLINFNADGTINALQDANGNIDIELANINWGNGSLQQNIAVNISRFSQFASDNSVLFSDQDGAELGLRTGIEIDREGTVIARFSNGASSPLYKLPLVTFANANGLQEVSGTAYSENDESGEENLRSAGSGGAGFIEPSTLENSNVDLADEFAKLIVSQRAFSAGTKIISTVDEMTTELLRLR